jgi:hypothetical protein
MYCEIWLWQKVHCKILTCSSYFCFKIMAAKVGEDGLYIKSTHNECLQDSNELQPIIRFVI